MQKKDYKLVKSEHNTINMQSEQHTVNMQSKRNHVLSQYIYIYMQTKDYKHAKSEQSLH